MKKNKILFIGPLPPPIHGAALRNLSVVESSYLSENFEIIGLKNNFTTHVREIGEFSTYKIFQSIIFTLKIIKYIILLKPVFIYMNLSLYGFSFYRDLIHIIFIKLSRKKILFHLRTQGIKRETRKRNIKKLIYKFIFNGEYIICLSKALSKDISEVYTKPPFIVNNGIKIEKRLNHELKKDLNNPVILFLSNYQIEKGILDLLEGLKLLKERINSFKCYLVGQQGDVSEEFIHDLINKYNLIENVIVSGPKYGKDKIEIFEKSDIFILPTHFEAFPGVLLEAMQFKLAIIATDEGAIPEILESNCGLIIQKHSPQQIAKSIETLFIERDLRLQLGQNALNKYLEKYTYEAFEHNLFKVFSSIIKK